MAFSEYQKERIEIALKQKSIAFTGKKMMGGYVFLIDDKMAMGLRIDKNTKEDRLMARIGEAAMPKALRKKGCRPMDITGRPMKGFVYVEAEGFDLDADLDDWIEKVVEFNPLAKRSKK